MDVCTWTCRPGTGRDTPRYRTALSPTLSPHTGSLHTGHNKVSKQGRSVGDPDPLVRGGTDPDPDPSLLVLSGLKQCLQNKIVMQHFIKKLNFED
jgi:hypothetical protein